MLLSLTPSQIYISITNEDLFSLHDCAATAIIYLNRAQLALIKSANEPHAGNGTGVKHRPIIGVASSSTNESARVPLYDEVLTVCTFQCSLVIRLSRVAQVFTENL